MGQVTGWLWAWRADRSWQAYWAPTALHGRTDEGAAGVRMSLPASQADVHNASPTLSFTALTKSAMDLDVRADTHRDRPPSGPITRTWGAPQHGMWRVCEGRRCTRSK